MRPSAAWRIIAAGICAGSTLACATSPTATVSIVSDTAIEIPAIVTAAAFDTRAEMAAYHFIVWEGGGSADHSLLVAQVSDVQVLDALESLGAQAGNALGIATWDERNDTQSAAPDRTIVGPAVQVQVLVPGRSEPLSMDDILIDPGGRGFDMRFGGHRENIPEWHSGCLVCLYSCPGSKVGNATYTVRDFVQGATHFAIRPGVLPADGTAVTVRFSLESAPLEASS